MRWFASLICLGEARRGNLAYAKPGLVKVAYAPCYGPSFAAFAWAWWMGIVSPQEDVVEGIVDKRIFSVLVRLSIIV